jgi:predicted enzyme related to lactoylglutathione lyase
MISRFKFIGVPVRDQDRALAYEELKSRGVEFVGEPKEEPWGTFAIFKDSEGNSFVLGSK